MKLSEYAKKKGVSYRTALRWFRAGLIKGYQMPTGTIIVEEGEKRTDGKRVVIYARVSDPSSKDELERQAQRLKDYAMAKGYQIVDVVKEVGSGVADKRKGLIEILKRDDYDIILVEYKDRLVRFGFNYLFTLLEKAGKKVEVANHSTDDRAALVQDFLCSVYFFSTRLYGLKRAKEKTERIKREVLENV